VIEQWTQSGPIDLPVDGLRRAIGKRHRDPAVGAQLGQTVGDIGKGIDARHGFGDLRARVVCER